MNRDRILSREVTATQIPSGDRQLLPSGTAIVIHQTLGGSYTVQTDFGLFRIDGRDLVAKLILRPTVVKNEITQCGKGALLGVGPLPGNALADFGFG